MSDDRKYKWVCSECGSDEVSSDATVRWDYAAQDWAVSGVHDGEFCDVCDEEVRLEQKFDKEIANENTSTKSH